MAHKRIGFDPFQHGIIKRRMWGDEDEKAPGWQRGHPILGLDHPRKRACLTAIHNFFLTRADGTTVAERFFGQKPRSMFAVILASVAIPPAPLSPPRRVMG